MSDNYGSGQPRVLNTADRSLDNVVFQYKVPPLTSEWNLINQIGNDKIKEVLRINTPSGWLSVGNIWNLQEDNITESTVYTGDVLTSIGYTANTFKLMSNTEDCVAIVNGWPITVKGVNSSDSNNIIELDSPTGDSYKYDFVFLEVWRKLIGENDALYPYGDVSATAYTDNELVYDVIGTETTKRVQIQYRIRSKRLSAVQNFNEGFDVANIYPIGGRTSEYQYPAYKYTAYGADDPGLYISGSGTSQDQTILSTVDGYVYAIPMFMVYRRKQGSFNTGVTHSASVTRQNYLAGQRSDRTDGKLLDVVYKDDIVDNRHKILIKESEVKDVMDHSFRKLVSGSMKSNIGKGFTNFSGGKATYSGGGKQLKVEQINGTGGNDIPNLSAGESSSSAFKRRVYANASVSSLNNIVKIPVAAGGGATWSAGTYDVSSYVPSSSLATISNVEGYFEPTVGSLTNVSYSIAAKEITISSGSNLLTTSLTIYLHVDLTYVAGNNGFRDIPSDMIEVNKAVTRGMAPSNSPVYLRYNLLGSAVDFDSSGIDENDGETDERDYIINEGNNFGDTEKFGMNLVIHRPNPLGLSAYTFSLTNSKLYGFYILGVRNVYENIGTKANPNWQLREISDIKRTESAVSPPNPDEKAITDYTITMSGITGSNELKITLFVGSKPDYYKVATSSIVKDEVNAFKFFNFNKEARGIIDVYEMIEVVALREGATDYFVADTVDKPILKIISKTTETSDAEGTYYTGTPYVYDTTGQIYDNIEVAGTNEINELLPVIDSSNYSTTRTPTRIKIEDSSGTIAGDYIKVPLLVSSYVSANEQPYNFYYDFVPYQGLMAPTSEIKGSFRSDSKACITSKGSGAEDNITLGTSSGPGGKAKFTVGSRFVEPISGGSGIPVWSSYLDPDDYSYYVRIVGDGIYFEIDKMATGASRSGWLVLTQPFRESRVTPDVSGDNYEIVRLDMPSENFNNIIDRMPSFLYEDYKGISTSLEALGISSKSLYTEAVAKIQDPLNTEDNSFTIGSASNLNNQTSRGVSDITLTTGTSDEMFRLSYKRPYIKYMTLDNSGAVYKKVFQSYLFIKITNGVAKPYLAVISNESNNDTTTTELNPYSSKDTIDLFELVGRPLIRL